MSIILKNILPNETGANSYQYEYRNLNKNNKKYVGIHKGTTDDTYHHTSSSEEFADDLINDDFEYHVLSYGTYEEMTAHENNILDKANLPNPLYYNKWKGYGVDNISNLTDSDLIDPIAETIMSTGTYGGNEIEYVKFDKKNFENDPLYKVAGKQIRKDTLHSENVKRLKNVVDEVVGDLAKLGMTLMVVILRDRFNQETGEKEDLRIGGNHTWEAILTSKHGRHMPILYIEEENHKDISDINIDLLGLYLNPRDKQIKTQSSYDDIAKQVHKIRVQNPGIQDNRHTEIRKIYKRNHLTSAEMAVVNKMVNDLLKNNNTTNTNWINWNEGEYKKQLVTEKDKWQSDGTTFCSVNSSGRASVGDDIIEISARRSAGEIIKRYVLILHHPSQNYLDIYDKKYRTKNKTALKWLGGKMDLEIVIIEKDTVALEA